MSTDTPLFAAVLTPHRSLGRGGFLTLMAAVAGVSFASGAFFVSIGAWPVFGFFGLDVLVLWIAFRASYASARIAETVEVTPDEVVVRRLGRGRSEEYRMSAYWARLLVERREDEGVTGLALAASGRSIPLGGFLNPPDRESLANALGAALRRVRTGQAG